MSILSPDIVIFKKDLEINIDVIKKLVIDSAVTIKMKSLLNITVYVLATRFLEGSVKHIIYNCCQIRGDNNVDLKNIEASLKFFNNPTYQNITKIFNENLNIDINQGLSTKHFTEKDITFLSQIVDNRHKNVHASFDSREWYNQNIRGIEDFEKYYPSLIKILEFLDNINFDKEKNVFTI